MEIFFRAGRKVKIYNFIGSFLVKGQLVEPETFTGVPCLGTEGLWRGWGKNESWFPLQPPKNLEIFFQAGRKVKIFKFIGSFLVKRKLVEPETFTGVACPGTEVLWKVWGKTESRFLIQSPKNLQRFLSSRSEGQTFKLFWSLFSKGYIR